MADTCHFCYINDAADKKAHKGYLVVIIEDHSRMIVGAGMSYSDNSYGFQKVLKQAVSTYGIPDKLYTDNGSPYIDKQLSLICGSIGTVYYSLDYLHPKSPFLPRLVESMDASSLTDNPSLSLHLRFLCYHTFVTR